MSRWDTECLSHAQVQYACLDAWSYEIGRVLSASAPTGTTRRVEYCVSAWIDSD
ncbi:unnamed protein product [Rhodiola kirilowii]